MSARNTPFMFDVRAWLAGFATRSEPPGDFERGAAALAAGRHEEALTLLEAAAAAAPGPERLAAILNKAGVAHLHAGRRDEAIATWCRALEAFEASVPTLVNLGNLLLESGAVDDAIDYYEAAIRIDPQYPLAYLNLGAAHRRAGRRAESVRCLRVGAKLEARARRRRQP